jgi:NADH-quinone oxidoreductase subunit E
MKTTSARDIKRALDEVESRLPARRESLIPALQLVQEKLGWLPREVIPGISRYLKVPESEIWGTASFYAQFRFTPAGRNIVTVCRGTACHVRGSAGILRELERNLGVCAGQTTSDLSFTLQRVACFGSCALAPVVVANGKVYGRQTAMSARGLLKRLEGLSRGRTKAKGKKK